MSKLNEACLLVEIESPFCFEDTVSRLVNAIQTAGLLVIARLDHGAGASLAGLELPPTLVLVYGHPKGGTPIMQAYPGSGLDLPLRVLVRQISNGPTIAAFRPVVEMLARHGVPEEMSRRLEPAQELVRRALVR